VEKKKSYPLLYENPHFDWGKEEKEVLGRKTLPGRETILVTGKN